MHATRPERRICAARRRTMPSRRLLAFLPAILLLPACATTPTVDGDSSRPALSGMPARDLDAPIASGPHTLAVRGMSCPKCVSNVDKQLARLPGVERATVDMKHGTVAIAVSGERRPTPRQLANAVEDAGFTLEAIDAASSKGGES